MVKERLDKVLSERGLVTSRSQAENYIKLGQVYVDGRLATKAGEPVNSSQKIEVRAEAQYVSRAALKLATVAKVLELNFKGKTVLDVGSSTGGFTDYALQHGAKKVIAVDVGTNQLHPKLRHDPRIELHEKTDIRSVSRLEVTPDIVMVDVSFISLRQILPHIAKLSDPSGQILALLKPQFEASKDQINRGVIKNDRLRRQIIKEFESWLKNRFVVKGKADSQITGSQGNLERFYLLSVAKV
jgi:23S rRNA (cytidine1920-2'-O)/16S rRNA (cytidine1409-2'-O)-methyltransferase